MTAQLRIAHVLLALFLVSAFPCLAGARAHPQIVLPRNPSSSRQEPEDEAQKKWEHDRAKKANEERFQKIKDDTEKLVTLSNELKDYVAKANEHTLSLNVIKKAEEIEKLAKSVKEKMKAN